MTRPSSTGTRCAICGDVDPQFRDEISGTKFCRLHAGAQAMSDRDINLYSLALRVAGAVDRPIPIPATIRVELGEVS